MAQPWVTERQHVQSHLVKGKGMGEVCARARTQVCVVVQLANLGGEVANVGAREALALQRGAVLLLVAPQLVKDLERAGEERLPLVAAAAVVCL